MVSWEEAVVVVLKALLVIVSGRWVVGNECHRLAVVYAPEVHIYQAARRVVLHFVVEAGEFRLERRQFLAESRRDGSGTDEVGQGVCHLDQLLHKSVLGPLQRIWDVGYGVSCEIDGMDHAPCRFSRDQHHQLFHRLGAGLVTGFVLAEVRPQFSGLLKGLFGVGDDLRD